MLHERAAEHLDQRAVHSRDPGNVERNLGWRVIGDSMGPSVLSQRPLRACSPASPAWSATLFAIAANDAPEAREPVMSFDGVCSLAEAPTTSFASGELV